MTALSELLAKKKRELKSKDAAHIRTKKFGDGQTNLILLPGWRDGDAQFWHDYGMHYVQYAPNKYHAHICMDKTFEKECDICAAIGKSISMSNDDETIDQIKKVNASQRYLVNAVQVKAGELGEVEVWELPATVFESIIDVMEEWDDIIGSNARPLIVNREGSGFNTKYTVSPSAKTVKVPEEKLKAVIDLDAVVSQQNPTKYKQVVAAVGSIAGIYTGALGGPAEKAKPKAIAGGGDFAEAPFEAEFEEVEPEGSDDLEDELDDLLDDVDLG